MDRGTRCSAHLRFSLACFDAEVSSSGLRMFIAVFLKDFWDVGLCEVVKSVGTRVCFSQVGNCEIESACEGVYGGIVSKSDGEL